MRKAGLIWSLAIGAMTATLFAKECPLTFKALTLEEAKSLPGGYGAFGRLSAKQPPALKKEPKAVSGRPLYGEVGRNENDKGFLFRVDESKGSGKGYDQLLLDLDQNGDLTDDPVIKLARLSPTRKTSPQTPEFSWFGPIEAPAARAIGPWRPVYFAELTYYRRDATRGDALLPSLYSGWFRLKPGCYLETTVELDGVKQKVGVVDSNANLRLGDEPKAAIQEQARKQSWHFAPADVFLRDANGSGKFDHRPGDPEVSPFGAMLQLGATPYRVTLGANYASLRVEAWTEALAELSVQPNGAQVRDLLLAWERKPNDWALIKAGVAAGRAKVPPGKLRLTGCVLEGTAKDGQLLVLGGSYRHLDKTVVAPAGQTTTLNCGAPFEVRLTADRATRSLIDVFLFGQKNTAATAGAVVSIQAEILGAAGETVATFAKGRDLKGEPAKPRFTVRGKDGKEVASGNLEYG